MNGAAKVAHSFPLADPAPDVDLGGVFKRTIPRRMRATRLHLRRFTRCPAIPPLLAIGAIVLSAQGILGQDEADSWRSHLEFGFTGASGNTSFSILTSAFSLTRLQQEHYELDLSGRLRWGRSDGKTIANDMQGTLKFDWRPQTIFSPFAFATAGRDVIRNVDSQLLAGGGAKWTFLEPSEQTKMSLSLAVVVDHENYDLEPGSTAEEVINVGRLSWRVKFDHEFSSGATFQHITFWQPRMSDFGDYNVDMLNSLSSKLLSNLSLVINHAYIHEEVPPPGAVRDDQRLGVVLRVSL